MENPENSERIQMERFIPVEIFRKKSNIPSRYLYLFFRSQRNDQNFLYHSFGLPGPGFKSRKSEKFTGILLMQSTTQSHSCFRCQEKYQYHLTENFHRNFKISRKFFTEISVQMVSARCLVFTSSKKQEKKVKLATFVQRRQRNVQKA